MPRETLTDKEKAALHALVKNPLLNDRKTAEAAKLKLSTLTAIRRRLRGEEMFRTYRIPMLQRIGMEILSVSYGSMLKGSAQEAFLKKAEDFMLVQNAIYGVTDMNHDLLIDFMPNYTEFKKSNEQFERFFFMHSPQPEDRMNSVLFPTGDLVMTLGFFDYTPVLDILFNGKVSKRKAEYIDMGERNLTKKEKNALVSFINNPEATDKKVAELAGISRQAASTMKTRFYSEGLMKQVRIPDMSKLGFEIIGLTHLKFNPKFGLKERDDEKILRSAQTPHFFTLFNATDAVILSVHRSFEEYSRDISNLLSAYRKKEAMIEETNTDLFSVEQTKLLKMHDYSDLLSRI